MTKPTLTKVRQMIARSSYVPAKDVTVKWVAKPRLVTYPTGLVGYTATVEVSAPGFRTRKMYVSADHDSIMIL